MAAIDRLGPGVPGRDGEPRDVDEAAAVAIGDSTQQRRRFRRQHRHGSDDAFDQGQPGIVVAVAPPLEQVAIDQATGEAHPDPGPGHGGVGQLGRNQVVERAIQVRQRKIDHQPGHRIDLGDRPRGLHCGRGHAASITRPSDPSGRTGSAVGELGQLLGPIGALPGEVGQLATEVPVRGGRRVDRAQQVEVTNDRRRA